MTRKVALIGGSFHYPTWAHQLMGVVVHADTDVDEVWYMPCYRHQFGKVMLDATERAILTERMTDGMGPPFSTCWFEVGHKLDGKFYDVLAAVRANWNKPGSTPIEFIPVVGTDCAYDIKEKWYRGEDLIRENAFIVIGRGGEPDPAQTAWFRYPPHRFIDLGWTCAATDVRAAIERGDTEYAKRHTPPSVWKEIERQNFYR